MVVTLRDIIEVMEEIAPAFLAQDWDNAGLQVGHQTWQVNKIWIALDATEDLVAKAALQGVSLLITHHPLIFRPIEAVDLETSTGRIIQAALRKKLAIFCAHTNLDSAFGGVNDTLAERLELYDTRVLKSPDQSDLYKLVVFVPVGYEEEILDALFESGAGKTEKYTHTSFRTRGVGTFKPGVTAKPFKGRVGETSHESEYRIEALVRKKDLSWAIRALERAHPYEEMAYDVYATGVVEAKVGLGRIGNLQQDLTLDAFAQIIKGTLGLNTVKATGDPRQTIRRVAVCSGSGRGLLEDFFASDAQVYVSGDLGYHDGRKAEALGRALIDIGHFASEHLVVESLTACLQKAVSKRRYTVDVEAYTGERDCFYYL
ncbi:MAG TPA: Nif3-like dinuclear metal center hexameric protein [Desulfobacterales bacterium]|nr:Nif3-like dinuclear metal center hexameric protein [Desulfobacterales bacterium]